MEYGVSDQLTLSDTRPRAEPRVGPLIDTGRERRRRLSRRRKWQEPGKDLVRAEFLANRRSQEDYLPLLPRDFNNAAGGIRFLSGNEYFWVRSQGRQRPPDSQVVGGRLGSNPEECPLQCLNQRSGRLNPNRRHFQSIQAYHVHWPHLAGFEIYVDANGRCRFRRDGG